MLSDGWGVRVGLRGSRADGKVRSSPSISSIEKPEINIMFCALRVSACQCYMSVCVCISTHRANKELILSPTIRHKAALKRTYTRTCRHPPPNKEGCCRTRPLTHSFHEYTHSRARSHTQSILIKSPKSEEGITVNHFNQPLHRL